MRDPRAVPLPGRSWLNRWQHARLGQRQLSNRERCFYLLRPLVCLAIVVGAAEYHRRQVEGQVPAAFNIPWMVIQANDRGSVDNILGAPIDTGTDGSETWHRGHVELTVSYNGNQVADYFLATDDPSGATSNQARLLQLSGAHDDAKYYDIEFVPALGHEGEYTGIKITRRASMRADADE